MSDKSQLTNHQNRIPAALAAQVAVPLRGSLVVVVAHDNSCPECQRYFQAMSEQRSELVSWDADLTKVAAKDSAGVVIVDQWGDMRKNYAVGDEHAFPSMDDVVSWVRYLAVECPECEGEAL